jgi:hypothetical protein
VLGHANVRVIEGDSYRVRESEQETAARRKNKRAILPARPHGLFRPVNEELRTDPAPESYLNYLRLKLRQAAAAPGKPPKIYPTDDR